MFVDASFESGRDSDSLTPPLARLLVVGRSRSVALTMVIDGTFEVWVVVETYVPGEDGMDRTKAGPGGQAPEVAPVAAKNQV